MKRIVLAILMLFGLAAIGRGDPAIDAKMDALTTMVSSGGPKEIPAYLKHGERKKPGTQGESEPMIAALVRVTGDASVLEGVGCVIRSKIGDIVSADIPLGEIRRVAALPQVVRIEVAKRVHRRLDVSVPDTGAGAIRASTGTPPLYTGATGRNVVVGIVDSGIDITHADFKDPATGRTRILYLWDQAGTGGGSPPTGFTYGREYTAAQIDAGSVPTVDTGGHGTHVAGIAAGNGAATGAGQPAFRYVGMAPESDIIAANALAAGGSNVQIQDAILYIQNKAAALGMPVVVNLSLGGHDTPHDGSSNFERVLDNASGPGKVIVASASNEGADAIHASGAVTQGGATKVAMNLTRSNPDPDKPQPATYEFFIWYYGVDRMGIQLESPTVIWNVVNPGDPVFSDTDPSGNIEIQSQLPSTNNGDNEIRIKISNLAADGPWAFTLIGNTISGANPSGQTGRFDAWIDESRNIFTSNVDSSMTMIDTAVATQTIAVAAYTTKRHVAEICQTPTVGNIACFSSRGPRRMSTSGPPLVLKPEIAAPGQVIISSRSKDASLAGWPPEPDGVHTPASGTSMSAPHVTGAVAILLQANPTLTPTQIKSLFAAAGNSRTDAFTGAVPNNTWGYGKLNISALWTAMIASGLNPAPAAPSSVAAYSQSGSVLVQWTASPGFDIEGYNVYRSAAAGGPYTLISPSLVRATQFTDTGATGAVTFFYVVQAVDTAGQVSPNSAQAANLPPTVPSGVTAQALFRGVSLAWTANTEPNLSGYNVYMATTAGGPYTKQNGNPLSGSTYTAAGLAEGTAYYFVIAAVNQGGQASGNSAQVSAVPIGGSAHGGRCFAETRGAGYAGMVGLAILAFSVCRRRADLLSS